MGRQRYASEPDRRDASWLRAGGPGARWLSDGVDDLIGSQDDDGPFVSMLQQPEVPGQRLLKDLRRRRKGLRISRSRAVVEVLVPTILEQKVTGQEAHLSYRQLVNALGERAPGPEEIVAGLMVPPSPTILAKTPYWVFHRFGIERRRAETIRHACSLSSHLDALTMLHPRAARERMSSLPGIGEWTASEVALLALGDADAVSVGDFHLPHVVSWAFTGTPRSDDATMLRLLEPFSGQRGRVIRLIESAGIFPPRRGPRQPIRSFRDR